MKDKSKRINSLKLEIEKLEHEIDLAEKDKKYAFAHRLTLILSIKNKRLESWISNQ